MVKILLSLVPALLIGTSAAGAAGAGGAAKAKVPERVWARQMIPGYWSLRLENVQEELKLTDQQKEKIQQISEEYQQQIRQGYQQDWAKFREMSAEDRKKKYAELAEKRKKQTAAAGKQVEEVLQPQQLEALKMIELRIRGAAALRNPKIVEKLGLSEKQKQQLRKNQEKLTKKIQQLQRKSGKKTLDLLTPEQLDKLKQLHAEGYRAIRAQSQ